MTVELRTVRLDELERHPQNPRRDVGDPSELAESIKAVGLMEPIIVAPGDASPWRLIAGHRRTVAAAIAGLEEIPALVRADLDTPAKQLEAMLVENLQRADLTPVEEAEAYQQLKLLGVAPKEIARATGRSKATVDRRLSLSKLPDSVRESLHCGQLTLGDAEAMVEFAGDAEALKALEKAVGTPDFRWTLKRCQQDRERAAQRANAIGEAQAAGRTVVEDLPPSWHWSQDVEIKPLYSMGLGLPEAEHERTCEHHVLVAGTNTAQLTPACARPSVHGGSGATAGRASAGPDLTEEQRAEQEELERRERQLLEELRAAAAVRQDFVRQRLARKARPNRDIMQVFVRTFVVDAIREEQVDLADFASWLGLDDPPDDDEDATTAGQPLDYEAAVVDQVNSWALERLCQALFAIYAGSWSGMPELLNEREWAVDGRGPAHIELLARLGYEPCEVERRMLAEHAAADGEGDAPEAAGGGE